MENYLARNVRGLSDLESDDASDCFFRQSFASVRNDSGVYSFNDCPSYKSGADRNQSLVDQFVHMGIGEKEEQKRTSIEGGRTGGGAGFQTQCFSSIGDQSTCPSLGYQDPSAVEHHIPNMVHPVIDPFRQDEDGDTQLHLSIIQPNPSLAIRLIELGQFTDQLNIQNDHHQTPLHLAVITNQPQLVRALVLSGASPSVRDKLGNVALHLACRLGHAQCVERLTAPISHEEQQYVWRERQKKGLETKMTMNNSFRSTDFCLLNYEGDSCLHLALSSVSDSKYQILDYLLNTCSADINVQEGKCGFSLLHCAVRSRDLYATQFLLSSPKTAVNQCCYNGYTPLDFAITQLQNQLADLLLGHGAVSFAMMSNSETPEVLQDVDFDDLVIAGNSPNTGNLFR